MILVTDASQRVALEITRCLGMAGKRVVTVERKNILSPPIAAYSKYSSSFVEVETYTSDEFKELCNKAECVIPVSTNTILGIFPLLNSRLVAEKFLLPDIDTFRMLNNKLRLSEFARQLGIPCPVTYLLEYGHSVSLSEFNITFPFILKLESDEGLYLNPSERYAIVKSREEYEIAFRTLSKHKKNIILQEYIEGEGMGWSGLCDKNGKYVARIIHRRIREYPLTGGPSACCESSDIPELDKIAEKIIFEIKWRGPIMLEFKRSGKDGTFKIIEVNPRYWGSLPLARIAGINIPLYHYEIVTNSFSGKLIKAKPNVKMNFWALEFKVLKDVLKSRECLPGKFYKAILILKDIISPFVKEGFWMYSDPMPVIKKII